ncbi:OmcA/MtrC family decaheme c-type cytochrome [bacterium]|nr:MAG: OmcA/MtrC family decaheme c-type cytochrome [bacterium]
MRRDNLFCFALAMFVLVALLGGCSSSNKEGQPVSTSITSGGVSPDANIQAEITGVVISSPPVVTFKLLDENGASLDPATLLPTRGIRFYIAQIKADGNYANYFGTTAPTYDTAGTIATVGGGAYTHTFSRDIQTTPNLGGLVYDAAKTHTVAIQVYRNVTDDYGKTFQQAKNVYFNFRPDGGAVTQTREIVATSNCNECHGKLGLHGGSRREVALCILCHNPGLTVSGVSFDFKVMVHKIHMGEKLPGNAAAVALGGYGFSIGSTSYAEVAYPLISGDSQATTTPIECTKCHRAGTDVNGKAFGRDAYNWKGVAKIENCTTCHDTTTFDGALTINVADATLVAGRYTAKLTSVAATPHFFGVWTDNQCRACHVSELSGDNAYKMSIVGHHTVIENSSLFTGLNFQILSVTGATAGSNPTVTFKITDNSGSSLSPAEAGSSYSLKLGYFRQADYTNDGMSNYGQPLSQSLAAATANADGSYTMAFSTAIPASATGTGVIGLEGRRTYNIPATVKYPTRAVTIGGKSVQYFFDPTTGARVTDPTKQRRVSVEDDKCLVCHGRLSLHGGNRVNSVQECVICHNPNATDKGRRPAAPVDGLAEQSVNFKDMIHKIHTGEGLEASKLPLTGGGTGYIIYGFGNSVNDFGKVRYPRNRRDCLACHIDQTPLAFGLPLPEGVLGTTTATGADANNAAAEDNTRITPMKAACVSCHDQLFAINHADGHVTGTGATAAEGCIACHRTGLLQGVDFSHKAVR